MTVPAHDTRIRILEAAEEVLRRDGFAGTSTRRVADAACVPLSQIHYHFGSKRGLLLEVLRHQNAKLVNRQAGMYAASEPLWKQWERACDFYDEDLASGYVAVLQEMAAAGWSDPEIGEQVRELLAAWIELLRGVAERAERELGHLGPFEPADVANLVAAMWLGAESMHLLGFEAAGFDLRRSIRRIGSALAAMEEGPSA